MRPYLSRIRTTCILLYSVCLMKEASPNGQFYVGFLGFANLQNLNYKGECCDGQLAESRCLNFCDLVFEVSVSGIDSDPASGKRPSEKPIDNDNAILFPTSYEGVVNPLTFGFRKWTGHVNITVDVYDIDDNEVGNRAPELVDRFLFSFSHEGPSLDFIYMEQSGQRPNNPSELRMVFRYGCDPSYYGQNCSIDCLVHPNNNECPDTFFNSGSTGVTDWMPLLTTTPRGTTGRQCGFTRKPQSSESLDETGSQTALCGNSTTLATERPTAVSRHSTTQRMVNTTPGTIHIPNIIAVSRSPSSSLLPGSPFGSQIDSFTTSNTLTNLFETTPSSNEVSMVISKSSTSSHGTGGNVKLSSPISNIHHTSTTADPNFSTLELSSVVPSVNILPPTKMEINSKPTFYNINGISGSTASHVQTLNSLSTMEIKTANITDTSNELNLEGYTGSTSSHEISSERQTDTVSGTSTTEESSNMYATPVIVSSIITSTTDSGSDPTVSDDGDAMDFWPAIVGGVLGALVLVAIIAFIFYYRKQKALVKRQDIYNVNPKRWALQPPMENGTTHKSDVALETEQV